MWAYAVHCDAGKPADQMVVTSAPALSESVKSACDAQDLLARLFDPYAFCGVATARCVEVQPFGPGDHSASVTHRDRRVVEAFGLSCIN